MFNLVQVGELFKSGPGSYALKWTGKCDDGLLFNVKTNIDVGLSGYCSQRTLLIPNKSP